MPPTPCYCHARQWSPFTMFTSLFYYYVWWSMQFLLLLVRLLLLDGWLVGCWLSIDSCRRHYSSGAMVNDSTSGGVDRTFWHKSDTHKWGAICPCAIYIYIHILYACRDRWILVHITTCEYIWICGLPLRWTMCVHASALSWSVAYQRASRWVSVCVQLPAFVVLFLAMSLCIAANVY